MVNILKYYMYYLPNSIAMMGIKRYVYHTCRPRPTVIGFKR